MRSEIDAKAQAVVDHPNENFAELLQVAGLDPAKHLRYADWSDSDFGDADITGWDFTGARLNRADLTKVRNIDKAHFNRNCNADTETEMEDVLLPKGVTVEMLLQPTD